MTKMIKMSLIAAVAVTGMTSVATAQPLEEAIKGVDVSGMLRYRYDDKKTDADDNTKDVSEQWNNYRLDVNTKAKVNDTVTANVTIGIGNTGEGANLPENTEGAAGLDVRNANFTFSLPVATVIAGKQSIPGPFVDNTVDDISRGTGIVALVPAGPVTIAAGHFVTHNVTTTGISNGDAFDIAAAGLAKPATAASAGLVAAVAPEQDSAAYKALLRIQANNGTELAADRATVGAAVNTVISNHIKAANATELAVLGKAGDVSFDVWYANVTDAAQGLSVGAKAAVAGITVDARYSTMDVTDAYDALLKANHGVDGKSSLLKVIASTKVGAASVKAGFATTGDKNGQFANRIAIDRDNDSQSDLKLWQASAGQLADATAFLIGAGMEVMPSVTITADYLMAAAKESATAGAKDLDVTELLVGATYAMSKNFSVHARYSMMSSDYTTANKDVDADRGRLELKYTF